MGTVTTQWVAEFIDNVTGPVNEVTDAATGAAGAVDKIGQSSENISGSLGSMVKKLGGVILACVTISKVFGFLKEGEAGFLALRESEIKLAQVMSNTMDAADEEVKAILNLADAQERLGVIDKATQVAGAQELATYVTKRETIETLLPVMNDMLAQQYGLNVSQEQAASVASMLGKVMDGQVGALSRYGYKFDEAQEKILKNGTEAERAAVLFEVVSDAVGGVNEALANTPEGKLKKSAIDMGAIKEQAGGVVVAIKAALMPVYYDLIDIVQRAVVWFDENKQIFISLTETVAAVLIPVLSGLWTVIETVVSGFVWFFSELAGGNPIIGAIAAITATLTAAYMINYAWGQRLVIMQALKDVWAKREIITTAALASWQGILAVKNLLLTGTTGALTAATIGLNMAFLANPITWIVALIAGLIAGIVLAWNKFEGFRMVVFGCWEVIKGFGNLLKEFILDRVKGIISGLGSIGSAIAKLFSGDFSGAWESAKQGVVEISGIEAAKNAVDNFKNLGDAYQVGSEKGAQSWAQSQEKKEQEDKTPQFGPLQSFQMGTDGKSGGDNQAEGSKGKKDGTEKDGVKLAGSGGGNGGSKTINMTVNNYITGFSGTKEMAEQVAAAINNRLSDGLAAI